MIKFLKKCFDRIKSMVSNALQSVGKAIATANIEPEAVMSAVDTIATVAKVVSTATAIAIGSIYVAASFILPHPYWYTGLCTAAMVVLLCYYIYLIWFEM